MKQKLKSAGIVFTQAAAIWVFGWACCLGISRLMELFHLGT